MRNLSSNAESKKNLKSATPINILKVEFDAPVGTRYYSDRDIGSGDTSSWDNAQGRVVDWGDINAAVLEDAQHYIADCRIVLQDVDKTLKGYLDSVGFERTPVTLYQHFEGNAVGDLVTVFKGILNSPINYRTNPPQLSLTITDISTYNEQTVGNKATKDGFPKIAASDEDAVIPIVFGEVKRSKMAFVQAGAETILAKFCTASDTVLYVDGSEDFTQDTNYDLRIDDEFVTGQFHGKKLTLSQRGKDVLTSTVSAESDWASFIDSTLPSAVDDYYVGYIVKFTLPDTSVKTRTIVGYNATTKKINYNWPIWYDGAWWTPTVGTSYTIGSHQTKHLQGARVIEVLSSYVYIANDAPSKDLLAVEGWGRKVYKTKYQGREYTKEIEGWIRIPPSFYTVNTNDTTTFPALGRAVTTVTFNHRPTILDDRLSDDVLYCDIKGIEDSDDGAGNLIENPALVIKKIMTKFMGLADGTDIDTATFSDAETKLSTYKFGFALREQRKAVELCADLAFQCRCELVWEEGVAKLVYKELKTGASQATIDKNKMLIDTLKIGRTRYDDVISEVTATYQKRNERKTLTKKDAAVESSYGRRASNLNLWAYNNKGFARGIAGFYLIRWKYIYFETYFETPLTSLELERGDWITIDNTDFFNANQKAEIVEITHVPGSGTAGQLDKIGIRCRLPVFSGCATGCELLCETGSCESTGCEILDETGCDYDCEGYACETSDCETIDEYVCSTACDFDCMTSDMTCYNSCEQSCDAGCTSGEAPTPTPTPTPTVSGPTPTPTPVPTVSGPTVSGPSPTPTVSGPSPTPTVSGPTVSGPTPTPTPTVSGPTPTPTISGPTPTPTVSGPTPTPTPTPAGNPCCYDCYWIATAGQDYIDWVCDDSWTIGECGKRDPGCTDQTGCNIHKMSPQPDPPPYSPCDIPCTVPAGSLWYELVSDSCVI